ncbi:hypothetical protein [Alkalicoccobacillus murimartini]|uniref:Prophage endopeptidase tail N-terminal domain-containing protein n=1 Tax=Alkalicoccobacillus murimartini TaxID=171685 RepID=A0ABT9YLY1_9BACI|nr:hypothetical protein [Alkalicoccobacillus murimartini]MDQ0208878.1 hypothetical protein [Alkalicoccobacillus murimartini]
MPLLIEDLYGKHEPLTLFKELTYNGKVNGEKTLTFSIYPDDPSFELIRPEAIVHFRNAEDIIRQVNEKEFGNKSYKQA